MSSGAPTASGPAIGSASAAAVRTGQNPSLSTSSSTDEHPPGCPTLSTAPTAHYPVTAANKKRHQTRDGSPSNRRGLTHTDRAVTNVPAPPGAAARPLTFIFPLVSDLSHLADSSQARGAPCGAARIAGSEGAGSDMLRTAGPGPGPESSRHLMSRMKRA